MFLSKFWAELFRLSGTKLKHSFAYHPQTDGQTEVVNRGLEQYLRAVTSDRPECWRDYLGWAEFCYNTSYHSSINMSPFEALYGRSASVIPQHVPGSTTIEALESLLIERDKILVELNDTLKRVQHRMMQKANMWHHEVEFKVGDLVWVKFNHTGNQR